VIHALRGGLAAAALLLIPLLAAAQPEQLAPSPPQRPIRTRPATPPPGGAPSVAPPVPGGPIDRSAGAEKANVTADGLVNLDFEDVELAVVIDTIAKLTGKNFVYDDRVRGRVTIISPSPIPVEQAFTVFESVLQVKGFTTVEAPGGVLKVIPIRDAKETSVSTEGRGFKALDSDRFVTRLIPLTYVDAEQISNTLKPLVSKEAALVSYTGTNTIILTDSASNITRILSIIEAIDVETFKEELALIRLQFADATVVADQLSQLFGAEVVTGARAQGGAARVRARPQPVVPGQPQLGQSPEATRRGQLKIITDERTNSLVALASRATLEDVRDFVRKMDVPVEGGGRIQVYYLRHADAEELADTLNSLLGGGGGGGGGAQGIQGQPQLAGQVTEIASGVDLVTADVATNSLVIQASPEGYQTLLSVIEKLDIARPQVLVEALIMEVGLNDSESLGFNGIGRLINGATDISVRSATDDTTLGALGAGGPAAAAVPFLTNFLRRTFKGTAEDPGNGSLIQGIIRASAKDNSINIISAPHILTSDNEEAEILIGNNIPIITSRVQSAGTTATTTVDPSLATSVNVERQDIGVTLRVTPQITEGDTLRMEIFQEITDINNQIQGDVGSVNQVGPALSNRRIENVVVASDEDTIVIGGLIGDRYQSDLSKVPWLGDIPVLGWLFKTQSRDLKKANLLVFLTPHIIRGPESLVKQSIVKREEFRRRSVQALGEQTDENPMPDRTIGVLGDPSATATQNPTRGAVDALEERYPLERMLEIERRQATEKATVRAAATAPAPRARYLVLGGVFADSGVAQSTLRRLIDAGYEGTLASSRSNGRVLLELRIGPYVNLDDAERTAEVLRRAHALAPQVLVQKPEDATP
jgi:general secretion pathway protein D